MKQSLRRVTATFMAASLLCPMLMVSGCGKKPKRDVPVVTEDMPWYQSEIKTVDPMIDTSEYTYSGINVIGKVGDYIVFESFGQRPFDIYSVWTNDVNDYHLCVYDLDGNYCCDENTKDLITELEPEAQEIRIDSYAAVGEDVIISASYSTGEEFRYQYFTYNVEAQEITSHGDIRSAQDLINDPDAAYAFTDFEAEVDGYHVKGVSKALTSNIEYHVEFTTPDGEKKDICVNDGIEPYIPILDEGFIYLGDSVFAFRYESEEHKDIYAIIDLNNDTVKEAGTTDEYSWLYDSKTLWDYKYYDGIGNALISQEGIKLLNVETHEEEMYINFDDCDINRYDVASLKLIDLQEDKVTLAGTILRNSTSAMVFNYDPEIVVLQRCDTNPHAGEKILTAASFDELSYPMAEAIRLFNLNNEEAIIIMDPKYSYNTVAKDIIFDVGLDDYTYDLQVKAAFMNLLSIDLIANEGPDIILGTMEYDQLNNPDMMLDLSDAVSMDGVYENIMGFATTDDKIFQVPVAVELEGILVNRDKADTSVPGFTYDAYREYLAGPCQGTDPCLMTKVEYLCAVLAEAGYTFRNDDGSYNYNNEDFAAAAAFVESLNLPSDEEVAEQIQMISWLSKDYNDHVNITTAQELLFQTMNLVDEKIIMGFPSSEARGLLMNVKQSVAVCAATGAPDACKDFVKHLLGEDIQTLFGKYDGVSVNCNAQAVASRWFADMMNDYYNCVVDVHSYQDRYDLEEPLEEVDPDHFADVMDGYIRNAAGFRHSDAAIEIIIREEIQAYFAGQKSIEEVMDLIQNRVDLYVSERG